MNDSSLWATPQELFDKLNREFFFVLDTCAIPDNAKCERFITPQMDGLKVSWGGFRRCYRESIWCNPPYGREIEQWVQKGYQTSLSGERVVMLLPNRSNAPWWHDYVMKAREIRFIRHKVPFSGRVHGVPFWGSVLVVFGPGVWSDPPAVSSYLQPKHERPA